MGKKGLSVHSMTISCPYRGCDTLQTIPVDRFDSGPLEMYSAKNHKCTGCGKAIEINGNIFVNKATSLS